MSDTLNLANSIWPNGMKVDSDGYAVFYELGTNKVDIPTTEDGWPKGNKLISPFVYQDDKLVGFCDTKAMTVSGSGSTTMPYTHIEADFASIEEGKLVINAPNATTKKFTWAVVPTSDGSFDYVFVDFNTTDQETINAVRSAYRVVDKKMYDEGGNVIGTWDTSKIEVSGIADWKAIKIDGLFCNFDFLAYEERGFILSEFNSDLSSLRDGALMFSGCPLTSFSSDLSSLTSGEMMFIGCPHLTTFSSDLSSLTSSALMFSGCPLTSFSSDLSSLTYAEEMFTNCDNLTSFTSNLPNLTHGGQMFDGCTALTSFSSDLSSLTNGLWMFANCTNLTSFTSDLPSLMDGGIMFDGCKLDAPSVKNIIDTINTVSNKSLDLGMGCDDTTEDKDLFAQEAGYNSMTELLAALTAKGWRVTAQYNGRPTTTYALRRPSEDTLPVFAKLEEVEESSDKLKSFHTHTSLDGSKKYRLTWFHETTGSTEGYTQYASLEEAIESLNIKPIERN